MKKKLLSQSISAVVATALGASVAHAAQLEEVVVTATKRSESAQDIPMTIQTLGEETLDNLGIGNFKDYIRYLAGVTSGGRGPGRNEVFIRGVSAGKGGLKIAGAVGLEPNVAMYLDEAPISMGGRNIDPYMTDMNRVEVLPGPQGTLYGASSQAGTVRLITNKPEFNEFSAGFDVSVSETSDADGSNAVEAYANIPIIDDTLAARIAVYNVKEGGYINNIRATKQIGLQNPGFGGVVPETRAVARNDQLAEDNFNDATYEGFRVGVRWAPNDDWDLQLQHTSQTIETDGVWDFDPTLGDLNSVSFQPDTAEDEFDLTTWTVAGRLASLDIIYTGSYLDRLVEGISDYSGYADVGPYIPYYICEYPGYASCGEPAFYLDQYYNTERTTHEFRLNTDMDRRLRLLVGVFYDDTENIERGDWTYPATIEQGFAPNAPIPGATSSNPNARIPGVAFFNDFTRTKEELSFFGELYFDITDSLTATVGARRYDIEIGLNGSSNFANRDWGSGDLNWGRNVDEVLEGASPADLSDTILKFNLQWDINDDIMVYGTWSEGYRPGGFNRNGGSSKVPGVGPFVPDFYQSDEVTNMEFGWKMSLLNQALRFNGSIYRVEWEAMQIGVLDFDISNLTFIDNVSDAEINGVEIDAAWLPTDNLSLFANLSFNDTELTDVPANIVGLESEGSPLALAPELQYVLRGRYDWALSESSGAFAQLVYQYTDDQISSIVSGASFTMDSYSTVDASLGYSRDNWTITLFGENLSDERADLFISNEDDIVKTTPNRPRTYGLRLSYRY
ncbi:MAG: TonB-dependent receptor [Congregibacter sp.]|nr:TonB-dependent receptor [Congregibacter sp.]